MRDVVIKGRKVFGGVAEGEALVSDKTFPGFAGVDPETGNVIDVFHELYGKNIKDKILIIRGAKGSSGWAGTFHLARLMGTAPAGLVFTAMTSKICLGIVVMKRPAITDLESDPFKAVTTGDRVRIDADKGELIIVRRN
jgi:uncharacterized protein